MNTNFTYNIVELLLQISEDDEIAFRRLYDIYRNRVYFVAYKMLGSETDAKDTLQDVFLKLWINRKTLTDIENFSSYLNVLVRNNIYDRFRKNAREDQYIKELVPSEWIGDKDQLFNEIKNRELVKKVYQATLDLPPQQRKVFELSRFEGMSHESIAIELGIAKDTVKKHLMAALKKIRQLFINQDTI